MLITEMFFEAIITKVIYFYILRPFQRNAGAIVVVEVTQERNISLDPFNWIMNFSHW